jgi:hypothetical protein
LIFLHAATVAIMTLSLFEIKRSIDFRPRFRNRRNKENKISCMYRWTIFFFCFRMRAGFMGERAVLRVSIFALQSFAQPDRAMFALSRLHQIGKMVRPTIRRSQEERLHHDPLIVLFGFLRSRGEFCVCERRRPTTSAGPEAQQATPAAGPILNVGSER